MRPFLHFLPLLLFAVGCHNPAYSPAKSSAAPGAPPGQTGAEVMLGGGDGAEVLAEGTAAVNSGTDITRDVALRVALRKAVEQGAGTCVNSETRVQNLQLLSDRIYSQSDGYVSSYRVVSETREGDLYRVAIRAKVKLDRIEDDLAAIGIIVAEQGRPRIMVVVPEQDGTAASGDTTPAADASPAETMLLDAFQSKGFPVVDAAAVRDIIKRERNQRTLANLAEGVPRTTGLIGMKAGAEIAVTGTAVHSSEYRHAPYSARSRTSTR